MTPDPSWYKKAIFYELHVRAFKDSNGDGNGDLLGVIEKLDHLEMLGVTCIWLLPIFPSPLKDDGYDVSNFIEIHPDFGKLEDLKQLIAVAHDRGMRVITDLVLNHTSDQHPWFQEARSQPESAFHDYYVWSDSPDKYQGTRIIFNDSESSNWTWDEKAGKYFWHRFFSHQPDLNFNNPAVHEEIFSIMKFWLDLGIDGFRLDAIPYLYEKEGSNSENLPETHSFLKKVRKFVDDNYPEALLLSEANQWPEDVLPYFGDGDEMHMAFHFPLMPCIFMALRKESEAPIRAILDQTIRIPARAQWGLFLRNHDELTLEMVTDDERDWMWQQYAPDPMMRINLGIRRRLAPLLDNDIQKILLAHSIILTIPGTPILYYGDEIGMGENYLMPDRDGVRTPMQWDQSENAGFSQSIPSELYAPIIREILYSPAKVNVENQAKDDHSLLMHLAKLIKIRQLNSVFIEGDFQWLDQAKDSILAYQRIEKNKIIYVLQNLSHSEQTTNFLYLGSKPPVDLVSAKPIGEIQSGQLEITLQANDFVWLDLSS